MISVYVQKTLATAKSDTPLTSGCVGTVVQFYFSSDWDGLNRTAVFETSAYQKETAELSADNSAVIPESVMVQDGVTLFIGVYGTNGGGSIVVPTVYANCGEIKTGANTEPGGEPVTPSQAQQLQNQIDDLDNRVDALEAGGGGGSGGGAVTSVNGQTGAVVLNASDVGALPDTTQIPVVPAALPNPNKLTFIGAVSAEYDGSEAVSVEIPEGGGGGVAITEEIITGVVTATITVPNNCLALISTDAETAGIESDDFLLTSVYAKNGKPIVLFNLGNLAYSQGPRISDGLSYTYSKYHETAGDKTIRIGLSETDTVLVKKIQY